MTSRSQFWVDMGVTLLVVLALGLAIAFAWFVIWRSGYVRGWRASRATPPTCPDCGYNLSGLTQCRCPECGAEYRIDDLWRHAIISGKGRSKPSGTADSSMPRASTRADERIQNDRE